MVESTVKQEKTFLTKFNFLLFKTPYLLQKIMEIKLCIVLKICLLNFKSLVNVNISSLLFLNDKIKFQLFRISTLSNVDSLFDCFMVVWLESHETIEP